MKTEFKEIQVNGLTFVPYIAFEEIDAAIERIANEMKSTIKDEDPLLVCAMNGAFMFASELLLKLNNHYEIDFARYSSYEGTQSTFQLKEVMPLKQSVKGRTVVIIEDLIDSGFTLQSLKKKYLDEGAKEVLIAVLFSKPDNLKCSVEVDYVGLQIEPLFILGHGLDYNGQGRAYKDIYQLKEEDNSTTNS